MWQLIQANKRRAGLLVLVDTLILAGVGFVFGMAISGHPDGGFFGLAVGLILAAVLFLTGYFAGDSALLGLSGARQIKREHHPQLWNIVEEMKIASGLSALPRVFIIEDDVPNAFACVSLIAIRIS